MVDLEARIKLVKDIKRFAIKELGIAPNNSFRTVKQGRWLYCLYYARKDKIAPFYVDDPWGWEVFEERQKAIAKQRRYEANGADTILRKVEAVGKHKMPILESLLTASKRRLTYAVLHENFHIHCKKNNIALEYPIEEAAADCFVYQGGLLYFQSNKRMAHQIERYFEAVGEFYGFINKYLIMLNDGYKKDIKTGRAILKLAEKEAQRLLKKPQTKETKERLLLPKNNALFLCYAYYALKHRGVQQALQGMHPKEYTQHKMRLYKRLSHLKDGSPIKRV